MPRLTILVPCLGNVKPFEDTLASILQNRPSGCQILVAHRGNYNDPWQLDGEVEYVEESAAATLVDLINAGLNEVRAEILHIVLAGTEATEGWTTAAMRHFADPRVAAVAPLLVTGPQHDRLVGRGVRLAVGGRRIVVDAQATVAEALRVPTETVASSILGPMLCAGFYRTDALLDIGGFEPLVGPDLADVDAAATLHALELRCVYEPESRLISVPGETAARSLLAGRQAERLFWRHIATDAWLGALIAHLLVVMGDSLGSLPGPRAVTQILGRLLALREWAKFRKFRRSTAELAEAIAEELGVAQPTAAPARDTEPSEKDAQDGGRERRAA